MDNLEQFIRTKSGVWKIKVSDAGNPYFECKIDGISFTVFEGSKYWEDNAKTLSKDLIELGDCLVVNNPAKTPYTENIEMLKNENFVKEAIENIRKYGCHYYLSIWDDRCNLNKFAELTTKGVMYLFD